METVKVEGRSGVASLLRMMADGIDRGVISLEDATIECSPDLVAVVNAPEGGPSHLVVVNLRLERAPTAHPPLAVEEELSHPGA